MMGSSVLLLIQGRSFLVCKMTQSNSYSQPQTFPPVGEVRGGNIIRYLWVFIVLAFLTIAAVFIFEIASHEGETVEPTIPNATDISYNENLTAEEKTEKTYIPTDIVESRIADCLLLETLDVDCEMVFTNKDIESLCEKFGDKCFYFAAKTNLKSVYCEKITDSSLHDKCEEDSFVKETNQGFIPDETRETTISDEEKMNNFLKSCLEKERLDIDCQLAFTDDSIGSFCVGFGDRCYYFAAYANLDSLYCEKINEEVYKAQCFANIGVDSENYEDDGDFLEPEA